jgi:hypothetical protein
VAQIRLDGGDVVRNVVRFLQQALAEQLHHALAEPSKVYVVGDVGLGLGRPALGSLVAGRSQQRLGVLPQPAAGVAQDQPANQLAVVGRKVLGDFSAGREAEDVDRPVEPGPDPAGIVVGHVAGGMAGWQAWPSCHLVDGVVAGVALVRPPKQPQGTPGRCLVLQGEAFEDDQRFKPPGMRACGSSTMDWPVGIWRPPRWCPIVSPVPRAWPPAPPTRPRSPWLVWVTAPAPSGRGRPERRRRPRPGTDRPAWRGKADQCLAKRSSAAKPVRAGSSPAKVWSRAGGRRGVVRSCPLRTDLVVVNGTLVARPPRMTRYPVAPLVPPRLRQLSITRTDR